MKVTIDNQRHETRDESINREVFRDGGEASVKMGDLSIEEVNDVEKFRSLRELWDALLQESGDKNIFLTWEWLFTWWQRYGSGKKLRIFLIKDSDKIIGIAPFMQSKYQKGFFSIDVMENICARNCDYSGIILTERKNESIPILLNCLEKIIRGSNIVVRIWNIPDNSNFLSVLREQYPSFSKSLSLDERIINLCPYIDLPATWDEYFHTLSKKRRGNLRRAMQSLQKDHIVEFKKYDGEDNLEDQLRALFELHKRRWQENSISSKFEKQEAREFCIDVSKAFHQNSWLNLSFLNVDRKPVSACWGFNYNKNFYYLTTAFDPSYSDYSVGTLHLMKLIEDSIQNGMRKFDLLIGTEAYKFRWAHCKTDSIQITIAKRGLGGRCRLKLLQILTILDIIISRSPWDNYHRLLERRRQRRTNSA